MWLSVKWPPNKMTVISGFHCTFIASLVVPTEPSNTNNMSTRNHAGPAYNEFRYNEHPAVMQWRIQGGTRDTRPLSVQILSLLCSLWQKFGIKIGWRPRWELSPSSANFWIHHCNEQISLHQNDLKECWKFSSSNHTLKWEHSFAYFKGTPGTRPFPLSVKILSFTYSLRQKIFSNNRFLTPKWGVGTPPPHLGNPWSATAFCSPFVNETFESRNEQTKKDSNSKSWEEENVLLYDSQCVQLLTLAQPSLWEWKNVKSTHYVVPYWRFLSKSKFQQEYIPVGCVPPASVAVSGVSTWGCVCPGWVSAWDMSAQ